VSCPECAKLREKIEGLKDALIMQKTLLATDMLAEGEEYRVIKVRKMKHTSGFTVIEDENA
jgi:hypothetical protein